jgi:hypothetical protein
VTEGAGTSGTAKILEIAEVLDPELWRFSLKVMRDGRCVTVEVTADKAGRVSHAGSALLGQVADKVGLTRALSRRLAGECVSDLGAVREQDALFGAELTDRVQLSTWPAGSRVIVRRERPHPACNSRSPTTTDTAYKRS